MLFMIDLPRVSEHVGSDGGSNGADDAALARPDTAERRSASGGDTSGPRHLRPHSRDQP